MWKLIQNTFRLNELVRLTIPKVEGGLCKIQGTIVGNYSGNQFKNVPLEIEAQPKEGYKFVKWEGINKTGSKISIIPTVALNIRPVFVKTN